MWASPQHWIDGKWSKIHYRHPVEDKTLCGVDLTPQHRPSWSQAFDADDWRKTDCKKCLKIATIKVADNA